MTCFIRTNQIIVMALLLLFGSGSLASAQSLWHMRSPRSTHMFRDVQPTRVGDLVTVIISESTDVANSDQRTLNRSHSHSGGFDFGAETSGGLSGSANLDANAGGNGNTGRSTDYSVNREFLDRITVMVTSILPNGNFVIQGTRSTLVGGEKRTLVLSGIVRPSDIRADNSIESMYVANFNICYQGEGIESEYVQQGWFSRAWNRMRPF
ncbi:MAG: flagellar basal body L-ring protein FlgH [Pirellulaceae bacterium]